MNDKISLVVPVFNSEHYLERCLDSLINQSYGNLEFLIVNDGSTDQSFKILQEYASRDERIKLFDKENGGIGSAYNVAFKHISGDYVLFVDSDDFLELEACEELIQLAEENNADMVHFASKVINLQGEEIKRNAFGGINDLAENQEKILTHFTDTLKHPSLINLFKSELFKDVEVFNQNVGIDEMLTPQLMLKMNRAIYTSKAYCNVVAREDSVSRSVYGEAKLQQLMEVYNYIIDYVKPVNKRLEEYYLEKYWIILLASIKGHWKKENTLSKKFLKEAYLEFSILHKKIKRTSFYSQLSLKNRLEFSLYKIAVSVL